MTFHRNGKFIYLILIFYKMPTYTYFCNNCEEQFELFSYIKDYNPTPKCIHCNKKKTQRSYISDVITQTSSVKKADSELKTIGDLAMRNTERMSDDEKTALYIKHNSYKDKIDESKPLPSGMKRIKKPEKIQWPGTKGTKKKRGLSR